MELKRMGILIMKKITLQQRGDSLCGQENGL
jgi:hypothetical protein